MRPGYDLQTRCYLTMDTGTFFSDFPTQPKDHQVSHAKRLIDELLHDFPFTGPAEKAHAIVGPRVRWHMIGHLQRNKARKAVPIFDMIETVDNMRLAREIDKVCEKIGKVMDVLIEINSAGEEQKSGVMPDDAVSLIQEMSALKNLRVMGLMTMGPFAGDPEEARPFFQKTREIFDRVRAMDIPGVEMKYLSMGMSNSYKVALEEGANLVRIGTRLFGERTYA